MRHTGIFRNFAGALAGSVAAIVLLAAGPSQGGVTINDNGACASWSWDGAGTLTCNVVGGPPPPPPTQGFTCSFSSAGTATVGTALPLTVTCSNGVASTFAWSVTAPSGCTQNCSATWGSTQSTTAGSNTVTLQSAGIWTVKANVTSTTGDTSQAQAPVQANAPVVAGGTNLCADKGFSKTIFYNWNWAGAQQSYLDTASMSDMAGGRGIGTNGILVIQFTPNGPADLDNPTTVSATGYPAPNLINYLTLAISTQPCDLYSALAPGMSSSTTPTVQYAVGTVTRPWAGPKRSVELTPGVTYYLNVAGRDNVGPTSPYGTNTCVGLPGGWNCDIRLSLQKPPGH